MALSQKETLRAVPPLPPGPASGSVIQSHLLLGQHSQWGPGQGEAAFLLK